MSGAKSKLRLAKVYEAMAKAEKLLPRAVDKLGEMLEDEETTPGEIVKIAGSLSTISRALPRVDDDLGLSRRGIGGGSKPLLVLLGKDIDTARLRRLSEEQKMDLFFAGVDGDEDKIKELVPDEISDA
jgi:hypothetical protein